MIFEQFISIGTQVTFKRFQYRAIKKPIVICRCYGSDAKPCGVVYRSRHVLLSDGSLHNVGIVVNSMGKISRFIAGQDAPTYAEKNKIELVDFGSRAIWPGVIDTHVHLSEPGRTEWEGFETGTKAAAWGGVTTIVDMPLNSIPPTTTVKNLEAKVKASIGKTYVDVAFWGGLVPDNSKELLGLLKAGVRGFKCFLMQGGDKDFPYVTKDDLETALDELQKTKSVVLYHAEMKPKDQKCVKSGINPEEYSSYLNSRPPSMETNALRMIIDLTEKYKVRSHIVHLSSASCLPLLVACRELPLTAETCPHYLTFTAENIPNGRTEYKCAPPIRNKNNQDALWHAIKKGNIFSITSDHSPSTSTLRGKCTHCKPDFLNAWGGIVGLQFLLPAFWTKASENNISMATVSRMLSENPAKLANLKSKGSLKVGLDADMVVWDPDREWKVTKNIIIHKDKHTPYLDMCLKGVIAATIVRGKIVYRAGECFPKPQGNLLLEGDC